MKPGFPGLLIDIVAIGINDKRHLLYTDMKQTSVTMVSTAVLLPFERRI